MALITILPPDKSNDDGSRLILNLPVLEVRFALARTVRVAAAFAVNVAPLPPKLVTAPIEILPLVALLASNDVFMLPVTIGALI